MTERKTDAHHKISLGGLVVAAGVDHWDAATLVGLLRVGADGAANNPELLALWRQKGAAFLEAREAAARPDLAMVAVRFHAAPPVECRTALKAAGLSYLDNGLWRGLADPDRVRRIAATYGGRIEAGS